MCRSRLRSTRRPGFPNLITSTRFRAGIVLAFVLAAVVWFLMEKTTVGYELKAVGLNQRAAACNGVPVVRSIIFSAFLSGGLAAIAKEASRCWPSRKS